MIKAHGVHYSRMKIMNMHTIRRHIIPELTRLTVHRTSLHPTTRHPHTETTRMMIPPKIGLNPTLTIIRSTKLAAPHHERAVEQAAAFQIGQ